MKKIFFLFCSILIVVSCNTKQTDFKTAHNFENDKTTLYVITINTQEPDWKQVKNLNELPPVKKDEITTVTADHFEISLNELPNGAGYSAQKNITEPASDKGIEYICDWCGAPTTFKTTDGFLTFMSARGYKLISKISNTNSIDYIFNKV